MFYINRRCKYDGGLETVDSFDSLAEARAMVQEYGMADNAGAYYSTTRPCKAWRDAERNAARPDRVTPARPVLAYLDSFAGLIPCVVTGARFDGRDVQFAIRFTGRRANLPESYKAGETDSRPMFRVVPRDAIRGRRAMSGPRILPYAWADSFPELRELRGAT